MVGIRLSVLTVGFALALALATFSGDAVAAESSAEAAALPFPPDARELEFVAWARYINFQSQSPLKSLAAFYLKEMAERGWDLDESEVEIDEDSIELTFKKGKAKVDLDLRQWSKEVRARMDCKKLKFTDTDDPAKLAAAGVPVPRAALFLQKEVPLPDGAKDLQYTGKGCMLKSPMKLQEAFDYFSGQVKGKSFSESRRPIITDERRYTEFKKGPLKVSVNVFTHEIGSRIVLGYEDQQGEPPVAPLPAVASLPIGKSGGAEEDMADETAAAPAAKTAIDVTGNKGSATVSHGSAKYTFGNVVCFQTKDRGSYATMVVFSTKPVPLNKMQSLVSTEDDPSFYELYEFESPDSFILQLGEYLSFNLTVPGVGIGGKSIKDGVGEIKVEAGRVRGTLKMPPMVVLSKPLSFTATIDAAILTPSTRIVGPDDPVLRSEHPMLGDSPVPMPEGAEDVSRKGSNFRKTYSAVVAMSVDEVASFYRKELAKEGWKPAGGDAGEGILRFKNQTMELSVTLKQKGGETAIEVVTRDVAAAKREGLFPEPEMGRLIFANGHTVGVVFTIGETDYNLAAGQGTRDPKQALNYSVPPGTYEVVIKIPGRQPQTEEIELGEGSTWGIVVLPTGGYMAMQMY